MSQLQPRNANNLLGLDSLTETIKIRVATSLGHRGSLPREREHHRADRGKGNVLPLGESRLRPRSEHGVWLRGITGLPRNHSWRWVARRIAGETEIPRRRKTPTAELCIVNGMNPSVATSGKSALYRII
jgi:hypothetical protein